MPEDAMRSVFLRSTGVDVSALLDVWVDAAAPIDVASVLARVGLEHVRAHARSARGGLGVKTKTVGGRVTVEAVLRGSRARRTCAERSACDGGCDASCAAPAADGSPAIAELETTTGAHILRNWTF